MADRVDTSARVDLPVGQPTSATADVSWDALLSGGGFALGTQGAMTCAEAQVDVVSIAVDPNLDGTGGTLAGEVACRDTGGVEGAQVSTIPAGMHSFAISGVRGSTVVYQTRHPASARFEPGLLSNVDVDADAVGSAGGEATLSWDFGTASPPCPVAYTLTDANGNKQSGSMCGQSLRVAGVSGLWGIDATAGAFQAHILRLLNHLCIHNSAILTLGLSRTSSNLICHEKITERVALQHRRTERVTRQFG